MKITHLIMDVDGVLNTGHMFYDHRGKAMKAFGAHDKDGIMIARKNGWKVYFITADGLTGWDITYARLVKDWGIDKRYLVNVSQESRKEWVEKNFDLEHTAFIGDGYHDAPILKIVKLGIAPASARREAKEAADFITESPAGSGAVLDACLHIEYLNSLTDANQPDPV
jgi:3-deoxy-D-manno-octulosonate 8-phosphate phosphatase (KDO 8-P phosphatase)